MHNLAIVHMLDCQADLDKPVEDRLLGKWEPFTLLKDGVQITLFTVIHNDAEVPCREKALPIAHNVGVFQCFEELQSGDM